MRRFFILSSLVIWIAGAGIRDASASTAPPRIEITARRFTYDPDVITLKKNETVMLVLESADVAHGLRIRELGLDMKTAKNKPAEMLFTPRKTGDFVGHCSVFCGPKHGTMKITFHIVE
jgi:cytochrome c oxidase subunit 2